VPIIIVNDNGPQPNMAMTTNCVNGLGHPFAVPSGAAIAEEEIGSYSDGYLERTNSPIAALFIRQYFH